MIACSTFSASPGLLVPSGRARIAWSLLSLASIRCSSFGMLFLANRSCRSKISRTETKQSR
jgi:hypothetical protein